MLATFVLGPLVSSLGASQYFSHSKELFTYLSGIFIYPINYTLPGVFLDHPYPKVNISLWTIPYEFTCYWVLPLILLPLKKLRIKPLYILSGFVLVLATLSSIFYIRGTHEFAIPGLNIGMCRFLHLGLFFFTGSLLYEIKFFVKKDINIFWIVGLFVLWIGSMYTPKLGLFCDFLFLPIIVLNLSFIKSRFNNFGKYGDFSYGMYLYGFIVQQLVVYSNVTTSPIILFFIAYPLTIILGYISWHTIEKRALKYKNLLKTKVTT